MAFRLQLILQYKDSFNMMGTTNQVASFPLQKRTNKHSLWGPLLHPMTTFAHWHPRNNLPVLTSRKPRHRPPWRSQSLAKGSSISRPRWRILPLVLFFAGKKGILSHSIHGTNIFQFHGSYAYYKGCTNEEVPLNSLTAPCPNSGILFYRLQVKNFGLQPDIAQFFTKHPCFMNYLT